MLAGPAARAHARDAARARRPEPRPQELDVGDEPVAARGRADGEGHEAGDAAAAGARRPRGRAQVRARRHARRARARERAPHGGARRGRRGREGAAARRSRSRSRAPSTTRRTCSAAIDEARAERDTVGGVVEVRARGVPPGLGSYATRDGRLDARLAAALMGIQAVKGVEIGDGFALAQTARLAGARRDRRRASCARRIAPAASRPACRTARRSSSARR